MYRLPTSITTTDGRVFEITDKGDFRVVLECFKALNDEELGGDERVLASLLIFYNVFEDVEDIINMDGDTLTELTASMMQFFNCNQKDDVGCKTNKKLIDWEGDEHIIVAAINNVAKTEIRSLEYLHWFTFMGYYLSIGESVLSTVVGIRNKMLMGKKLEDYEKEFSNENPQYFNWDYQTQEDKEMNEYIKSIWNQDKEAAC